MMKPSLIESRYRICPLAREQMTRMRMHGVDDVELATSESILGRHGNARYARSASGTLIFAARQVIIHQLLI